MSYIVGRVSGEVRVDPDAGGQGRERKREKQTRKAGGRDSVSISDEARTRSVSERDAGEAEEL